MSFKKNSWYHFIDTFLLSKFVNGVLSSDKMKCIHYLYWIYTVRSELETHCLFDKGLMKSDIMSDCISCAKLMFKNVEKILQHDSFLVTQSIIFISFSKECFNFFYIGFINHFHKKQIVLLLLMLLLCEWYIYKHLTII